LARDDVERATSLAIGEALADADDRRQPRPMGRRRLGADQPVILGVQRAALGMTDDHITTAKIRKHPSRDIAREGAAGFGMAILPPQRHRRCGQHRADGRQQCRRPARRWSPSPGKYTCPVKERNEREDIVRILTGIYFEQRIKMT